MAPHRGGRVAEMFGEGQVETDMFLRTLGFERLAAAEYEAMPADFREALDAYAAGVNAYLADRPGGSRLSLEYAVLGIQNSSYEPQPWEPIDTLMWCLTPRPTNGRRRRTSSNRLSMTHTGN